jgi:hypothetical protein
MPYYGDIDFFVLVVDFINNPIFANSHAPKLGGALQLFTTMGSWIISEILDLIQYASGDVYR